jgi:hypothetical protein
VKLFLLIAVSLFVLAFLFLCFLLAGGFDMIGAWRDVSWRSFHADTPVQMGPVKTLAPKGFRVGQKPLVQITPEVLVFECLLGNYYEAAGQRMSGVLSVGLSAKGKESSLLPKLEEQFWAVTAREGSVTRAKYTGNGMRGSAYIDTARGVRVEVRAKGDVYDEAQTRLLAEEAAKAVTIDQAALARLFAEADEEAQMRKLRPGMVWAFLEKRLGTAMPKAADVVAAGNGEFIVFNSEERNSVTIWSKLGEEEGGAAGIEEAPAVTKKTILQPHVANGLLVTALVNGELKAYEVKVDGGPIESPMPNWPDDLKEALRKETPPGKAVLWRYGWTGSFSREGLEPVQAWFADADRLRASAKAGEKPWKRRTQ